jgi:site-specific DNA recombinase
MEIEILIAQNARSSIDQKEYNRQYSTYAARYNELQKQHQELSTEIARLKAKRNQMKAFITELKKQETLLTEFDESLWAATLKAVVIKSNHEVIFQFKHGTELSWSI